jgi:drug/metabolite transporter (DMT)-like permease
MYHLLLYLTVVLVWGSTWYAIRIQVSYLPAELSVFYRALLASLILGSFCKLKGWNLRFKAKDHVFLCLMGLSMFSMHFLFVYEAVHYVASGVVAVLTSSASFLNIFHNFIFFKIRPRPSTLLASFMGITGVVLFFLEDCTALAYQSQAGKGIVLGAIGGLIFSFGGVIVKRNTNAHIPIIPAMAWGLVYASLALLVYLIFTATPLSFPSALPYWLSLLYLVLFGSVLAFFCYFELIKAKGPEMAGYVGVVAPLVALFISHFFEGYRLSIQHLGGLVLVLGGNILMLKTKPWLAKA